MKLFAFMLFVLCMPSVLHAQNRASTARPVITLTGTVTDVETKAAIPGASIYFSEAKIGAIAGADGRYTVRNIPSGHYLVEVSSIGYTALVEHIDIVAGAEKNFVLTPAVIENRGVTVTGVTASVSTRNTPVPVTIVRRSELMQSPSTNIVDALSRQPGVSQISTGPAISKPVIRGLSYNRVVVMNDGQRQEGQQWGDEHGVEIDELSVQRAEILKGAASLVYGSDAIGGVLHLITHVPVAEGTIRGNIYSGYQTNNKQVGLNANIAGNSNGFNWNAYGSHKSAGDYQNKWDGRVLNSRFHEKNFGGYVGINKRWGFSHLILSSFNQHLGVVEGTRDAATGEFLIYPETPLETIATKKELNSRDVLEPRQHVKHFRATLDNSIRINRHRLKLNAGYQNNRRAEFGDPEAPKTPGLLFDLSTVSYNLQWQLPESRGFQTTVGASGMYQNNMNGAEEVLIPDYDLFDIGGFVFVQKTITNAMITGGVRYDNRDLMSHAYDEGGVPKFEAFNKTFNNISGSLGISYFPVNKLTLKANVARGFRAPTISELASNGAHEGTSRFEYGTRDLRSERSLQFDLGVDLDYNHLSLSASGFYNQIQDYIFYRRLESALGGDSIINVDGEDLEAFRYNQNAAALYGFEFSADVHPHPLDWLHFVNSFSLVRGKFFEAVDNSKHLPMIPGPHWVSELRVNFKKGHKPIRNFYAMLEMDKTFEQDRPFLGYNTETHTPAYALLNAGLGFDIQDKHRKTLLTLHISGNNLTDETYQNHLSRLKYADVNAATGRRGVFGMGRNFSFKLNIPLQFSLKEKAAPAGNE